MTRLRNLIFSIQLVSLAATAAVFMLQLQLDLSEEQIQLFGGNLTIILLVLGLINHHQATKGRWFGPLITLPGLVPPIYALMSGVIRHLVMYHIMIVLLHLMVYIYVRKAQNSQAAKENDQPGTPS